MKIEIVPEILDDAIKNGKINKGRFYRRIEFNDREKAFADLWQEENRKKIYKNSGQGILQDLFIDYKINIIINPIIRYIVATIIQWLGSNCGWWFLGEALKRCGYKIVKMEKRANNA